MPTRPSLRLRISEWTIEIAVVKRRVDAISLFNLSVKVCDRKESWIIQFFRFFFVRFFPFVVNSLFIDSRGIQVLRFPLRSRIGSTLD